MVGTRGRRAWPEGVVGRRAQKNRRRTQENLQERFSAILPQNLTHILIFRDAETLRGVDVVLPVGATMEV